MPIPLCGLRIYAFLYRHMRQMPHFDSLVKRVTAKTNKICQKSELWDHHAPENSVVFFFETSSKPGTQLMIIFFHLKCQNLAQNYHNQDDLFRP